MTNQTFFTQAIELFETLTTKQIGDGFVYRGHGKAEYELVPSFQRCGVKDNFLSLDDAAQLTASSWPYRVFYRTANQMGLPLPIVSTEKHQNYTSESDVDALFDFADEAEREYDADDLEIMAFAQHYQVPTQLLDWSRSPLVALYFSASGALNHVVDKARETLNAQASPCDIVPEIEREKFRGAIEGRRLSVWQANSLGLIELSRQRNLSRSEEIDCYSIRFFTPRTQGNQNIVAQQGLFSVHLPHKMTFGFRYADAPPKSLQDVVEEHVSWLDERGGASAFLRSAQSHGFLNEYLLPYAQVVNLLKLLRSCGIHAASIYPGHKGCAKLVQEQAAISLIDRLL